MVIYERNYYSELQTNSIIYRFSIIFNDKRDFWQTVRAIIIDWFHIFSWRRKFSLKMLFCYVLLSRIS